MHEYLAGGSKQVRNDFVELCRVKPPIAFKTLFWTFQPRKEILPTGFLPFNTWQWQDERIEEINHYMLEGGKLQIGKSREVGATWIILGCGLNLWLFTPRILGYLLSRKEECVDAKGNPDCLFWKLDFMIEHLPEWVKPGFDRTYKHLENTNNHSVIDGESTNVAAGKGGRRNWVLADEFPEVPIAEAKLIEGALSDTASCKIFLGTAVYRAHPFSKMGSQEGVKKYFFGWWLHPFKSKGLYWSPDINKIIIEDIDFYRKTAPKVFNKYQNNEEIKYSDLQTELFMTYPEIKISFIADGGDPNKPKWRSPWYDKECRERTEQNVATNLDGNAIGSGDMVFTPATLNQMLSQYVRKPDFTGEVIYTIQDSKISSVRLMQGGKGRLKWWGDLGGVKPPQNHNYVIGCDISLGQGQSNSVCSIFDVDSRQKVGSFVDSHILPENFAEQVYAIGQWAGGMTKVPLLGWENNGIGQVFGKRIRELGYGFVYKSTTEKKGKHERLTTVGWTNNSNSKLELLSEYNGALTACFYPNMPNKKFVNPDEDAIREAEDYIFEGSQLIPSHCLEDSGGARAAHGDRPIADGICNLIAVEQPKAAYRFMENITGSIEWRKKRQKDEELAKKDKVKLWLNF